MMQSACRLILTILLATALSAPAAGKQVHVFRLDQKYWDVRRGDTLGEIATALLPASPGNRVPLMRAILEMNPGAFIDGDPNRLRNGVRLWLPGGIQTYAQPPETGGKVKHYDWGSIRHSR